MDESQGVNSPAPGPLLLPAVEGTEAGCKISNSGVLPPLPLNLAPLRKLLNSTAILKYNHILGAFSSNTGVSSSLKRTVPALVLSQGSHYRCSWVIETKHLSEPLVFWKVRLRDAEWEEKPSFMCLFGGFSQTLSNLPRNRALAPTFPESGSYLTLCNLKAEQS